MSIPGPCRLAAKARMISEVKQCSASTKSEMAIRIAVSISGNHSPESHAILFVLRRRRIKRGGIEFFNSRGLQTQKWNVTGSSCAGSACGKMISDLYVAPNAVPSLPYLTLPSIAKADPTAKASVTFHIVQPAPQPH